MKEEVIIGSTDGPIQLIGGPSEDALFLEGVPVQFTWLRETGTTMRYQIAKSIYESDVVQDRHFADFVKQGSLSQDSLAHQFLYILQKLRKWRYQLEVSYLQHDSYELVKAVAKDGYYHQNGYGGLTALIQTQAYTKDAAVEKYSKLIRNGAEPIVIMLKAKDSANAFILDGHHKLLAYAKEQKAAKAFVITKLETEEISEAKAQELLRISGVDDSDYQKAFFEGMKS
ncbi:hypothetical protein [Pontibacter harenae]|uniref:hypothetical protein n=1 Tax=Pontibacter harenae TaxID=2894083 RepID=UPI001E5523EA|nr:hypothetical protein [Pontibacter harenae]MCC9168552.1 hypothetical protein [Pontibacter harenae]